MMERRPHWDAATAAARYDREASGAPDKVTPEEIEALLRKVNRLNENGPMLLAYVDATWELVNALLVTLADREATIQAVRELADGPVPAVHGDWMSGYSAAMRDVRRALDGA